MRSHANGAHSPLRHRRKEARGGLVAAVLRRRELLLWAPAAYIACAVVLMSGIDVVPAGVRVAIGRVRRPPGSVYRSNEVFRRLWPCKQTDGGNASLALATAWHRELDQTWRPCIQRKETSEDLPESNGFLIVEAIGGLNQQRLSICDAVAVAGLLNATLVIPIFHLNSVWRDSSKFSDIFDEEYFIDRLKNHVLIVKELPDEVFERFDYNLSNIVNLRVKAWSSKAYYLKKVLSKLLDYGTVRIAPFSQIQNLRCLANFDALRFSQPIRVLSEKMVERMWRNSSVNDGKYISVHLRFEKDMVAFSLCVYDGGDNEKREMDVARESAWRGKFKRPMNPHLNYK